MNATSKAELSKEVKPNKINDTSSENSTDYIGDIFRKIKNLKLKTNHLHIEAQQKRAEQLRQKGTKVTNIRNVRLIPFQAPEWGASKLEYETRVKSLRDQPFTPEHLAEIREHQQNIEGRIHIIKEQAASDKEQMATLQQQEPILDERTEELAESIAFGDAATTQAIEANLTEQHTSIESEKQQLQGHLQQLQKKQPSLEQAVTLLNVDLQVCGDIQKGILQSLLLQEYVRKQAAFKENFAALKPLYLECVAITAQLKIERKEYDQLAELMNQSPNTTAEPIPLISELIRATMPVTQHTLD